MCGPAADDLLAYQTLKVVRIKDHRLGVLYYGLILAIAVFIFGYEMLYCNNHFDKRDVSGTARLNLRHPTMNFCSPRQPDCLSNFTSLRDVPYCKTYRGSSSEVMPNKQGDCIIADKYMLLPDGVTGSQMLIPTMITTTEETQVCKPGPSNNWTCDKLYEKSNVQEVFVGDIEKYSILLSHSYHRDSFSGNNNRVMGYYLECDTSGMSKKELQLQKTIFGATDCMGTLRKLPIECLTDECNFKPPFKASSNSSSGGVFTAWPAPGALGGVVGTMAAYTSRGIDMGFANDGVFAVPEGDVFSLGKLLQLSGISSLDTATSLDGNPLRRGGTVINVDVEYSNLIPFASTFGQGEVTYEYSITQKPLHQVQDDILLWQQPGNTSRVTERKNGVLVVVNVKGSFGFFSLMNLMLMLAEAASMLAVATILTDKIAIYLMERAPLYYGSKYEEPKIVGDEEEA
eukprot:CAMPEP_0115479710 /NCGR_PEP_ID=MMETSP0271-20121206/56878_1 /TAXON_ID=71861 /ORGANISM="Scrippsiella trochoidea, Strain CCMP3099" /LENGTH=456 /DNA_ID=CAMNT_0002907333 /DNA_START=111 /DNA_END=1481 /DNA_ORIENTATION=+